VAELIDEVLTKRDEATVERVKGRCGRCGGVSVYAKGGGWGEGGVWPSVHLFIRVVPLPKQPILDSSHQDVDNEPFQRLRKRCAGSSVVLQGWSTWRVRSISQKPRTQH